MLWFSQFHLMRPEYLLALLPLALLLLLCWRIGGNSAAWHKLIDADLMPHLFANNKAKHTRAGMYLLGVSWLLAAIALAGPSWQKLPSPVYEKDDILLIVLDNTPSMLAQDNKPSRAVHAARKIDDILRQRREGQTALITYSEDAFVVSPLTRDTNTIALLANALSPEIMPAIGNRPLAAITLALELVKQHPLATLLWLTDEVPSADSDAIIERIRAANVNLRIMGIGTTTGAPIPLPNGGGFVKDRNGSLVVPQLNRSELQRIASATGGKYSDTRITDDDIRYLLSDNPLRADAATEISELQFDQWRDESWLIALLLLIPAALAFRQGSLFGLLLLAPLLYSPNSHANWFDDLWHTKDQQAATAFKAGDTKTAAELFENSQWRAAAEYKNGNYKAAIKHYQNPQTAQDWYNLGNAYAKNQQFTEALAAYDHALALQPQFDDASANKALLEALQEQQQQQQQQAQNDQHNDTDGDQNSEQPNQQGQQNQQGEQSEQSQDEPSASPEDGASDNSQQTGKSSDESQAPADPKQAPSSSHGDSQAPPSEPTPEDSHTEQQGQAQQPTEPANSSEAAAASDDATADEAREALPAQLRNIHDDPGGLLKRKFADQASQRQRSPTGEQRW